MVTVFVTGSSDGLGLAAGRLLAEQGCSVVLHARDASRAQDARTALPAAADVLVGDVSTLAGMRALAEQADAFGRFDAVIHNVGLGYREPRRVETEDGLSRLWAVNVLAPYVLTALMARPDRLVYLSSGMAGGGAGSLDDAQWSARAWDGSRAYAETKLHDLLLTFAVARRWPGVLVNAVSPGWVPTRMGGPGAWDDLEAGPVTQAWLAVGDDPGATITGGYLHHQRPVGAPPAAHDEGLQDRLLETCRRASGIALG